MNSTHHPIHLIIKSVFDGTLFECTNYIGPIPHDEDWVRVNALTTVRVISRTFDYKNNRLETVILEC